ncbi:MAG: asparagine synthetase B family protein [Deltaproteobacteria bacterium]
MSKNTINIRLENRYAARWRAYTSGKSKIWIRGTIFFEDRFYREYASPAPFTRIASLLDDVNQDDFGILLNQLNGFFAVVIQQDNTVFAAVDRVRSIPLFYGEAKGQVFLSDDAEWIRRSVGDTEIDPFARQEFLFTGYVTGRETLFPRISQLQAGELLLINSGKDAPKLNTHRYYRFLHTEPECPVDEESLLMQLDFIAEKSVQRLIDYADGRQIVVPLSAGYDSRLIVTLLRRLGYEHVLTFSYGATGNHESLISKAVAESLNYPWEFVKYSNSLWRTWWNTKERIEYQWWASEWSSLPVFQDWPAVWQLRQAGKLKQEAVFVPGHSGDMVSGSHIPKNAEPGKNASLDDLVQSLVSRHNLTPWNRNSIERFNKWYARIIYCTEVTTVKRGEDFANWVEKWDWQERQAKFIINSSRAYEFWGYDWYLPLWDRDFMFFWQRIPLRLRKEQSLYIRLVEKLYEDQCVQLGRTPVRLRGKQIVSIPTLRHYIQKSPIGTSLIKAYRLYNYIVNYYTHPLRWYGIQDFKGHIKVRTNTININSTLVLLYFPDVAKRNIM